MANKFNANTNSKFQAIVNGVMTAIGNNQQVDLTESPDFQLIIQVSNGGRAISVSAFPEKGPSNAFGLTADEISGRLPAGKSLKYSANQLP